MYPYLDSDEHLTGWTIYDRPEEFPDHIVVRQWWAVGPGQIVMHPFAIVCDSLEEAREQIPAGRIYFPRDPDDDLVIVETWL